MLEEPIVTPAHLRAAFSPYVVVAPSPRPLPSNLHDMVELAMAGRVIDPPPPADLPPPPPPSPAPSATYADLERNPDTTVDIDGNSNIHATDANLPSPPSRYPTPQSHPVPLPTPPPTRTPTPVPGARDPLSTLPYPVLRVLFGHLHHTDALVLTRTCRGLQKYRALALANLRFPAGRGDEAYTAYAVHLLAECFWYFDGLGGGDRLLAAAVKSLHIYDVEGDERVWPPERWLPPPEEFMEEGNGEGGEGGVEEPGQAIIEHVVGQQHDPAALLEETDEQQEPEELPDEPKERATTPPPHETNEDNATPPRPADIADGGAGTQPPPFFPPLTESTVRQDPPSVPYLFAVHDLDLFLHRLLRKLPHLRTLVIDARSAGPLRAWSLPLTFAALQEHPALWDLALLNVTVLWRAYLRCDGSPKRPLPKKLHSIKRAVVRGGLTPYHGQLGRVENTNPAGTGGIQVVGSHRAEDPLAVLHQQAQPVLNPQAVQQEVGAENDGEGEEGPTAAAEHQHEQPRALTPEEWRHRAQNARLEAWFLRSLEDMDPARMGRRIDWAAWLLYNGWFMGLLDLHETFAGAWPGQPEDDGSAGGGWVHAVAEMNRRWWASLTTVCIRTEERLVRFYEDLMRVGVSASAWSTVEALSLDVRYDTGAWENMVLILPCMGLLRLRLVVYPNDVTWEDAVRPGGALGRLIGKLPRLEELVIDCPGDVPEDRWIFPGTVDDWATTLALAPTLRRLFLPSIGSLLDSSIENLPADEEEATEEGEALCSDSGYASETGSLGLEVHYQHKLDDFAAKLFQVLPPHVVLSEIAFLPPRSFSATCTVRVLEREETETNDRPYKRFWEHDWEDWQWLPRRVRKPRRSTHWFGRGK